MTLFPEEKILITSDSGEITLTTHRIWQTGNGRTTSIMLESITSCKSVVVSNTIYLIIGVIILLFGVVQNNEICLFIGVLPIGYYFFTKRGEIYISSPTATIAINVKGMSEESVNEFISKVERAKGERMKNK